MRNHLPAGAIRQQPLWNLGKGKRIGMRVRGGGKRGKRERESEHQHQKRTCSQRLRLGCWCQREIPSIAPGSEQVTHRPCWSSSEGPFRQGASQSLFYGLSKSPKTSLNTLSPFFLFFFFFFLESGHLCFLVFLPEMPLLLLASSLPGWKTGMKPTRMMAPIRVSQTCPQRQTHPDFEKPSPPWN